MRYGATRRRGVPHRSGLCRCTACLRDGALNRRPGPANSVRFQVCQLLTSLYVVTSTL
jgi:hypothetical protein